MAAGHEGGDGLHHPGDGFVHRLPAHVKIAATVLFVVAVVATPRQVIWAFALDVALLVGAARAAALPAAFVARRLRIEAPFLAFAVLLPLIGRPPRVEVLGISWSSPGLWAAWEVVAKGTLGVGAAILLGATTPVAELLRGMERLRVPRSLTAIAGFMVRYLAVIVDEAARMRIARVSRGYDARWLGQARATAASAGTLFVRSYERGERVHLAMLSRGYAGALPVVHEQPVPRGAWMAAGLLPLAAGVAMVGARVVAA